MKKTFTSFLISFLGLSLPQPALADLRMEAESASHQACQVVSDAKYSGGEALELTEDGAEITFLFNATEKGKYTIHVGYDALYGEKVVNLSVNGSSASFKATGQTETAVGTFMMHEGSNSIRITPGWTWFRIDYIRLEESNDDLPFQIASAPVDPHATESAREMYAFLRDNFGKKTISGIMTGDMTTASGDVTQHADMKAAFDASGKHPALVGFDFMNATGRAENESWSQAYTEATMLLAKDTYRRGGLPAFTWHWRDPSRQTGEFYTGKSHARITDAMNSDGSWNTSSPLYQNIIQDIDAVADLLLELQVEGMACIFRPLHEASGGWFWWGSEEAEKFVKLYRLLFREIVEVKGVHNVLWVWNADTAGHEWNPGEDCFDIVSADIYNADFDYSSNYVAFDKLKRLTGGKKIIALSENGPVPDIDLEFEDSAVWSWWMPWYQTWGGKFVDKTSPEQWRKCMNDTRVITLPESR